MGSRLSAPRAHHCRLGSPAHRVVARVIDGDTLDLDGAERVRLIGVDTRETVHPTKQVLERFGREASAFTKRLAEGKRVRLEVEPAVGLKDRYGRTLGYVWLPDGTLLNLEIIRGYGFAYMRFPFSRSSAQRALGSGAGART